MGIFEQQSRSGQYVLPSSQIQNHFFNPNIEYDYFLLKMLENFEKRWSLKVKSPSDNLKNYNTVALIGVGSFGKVRLVRELSSNKYYAAKEMLKDKVVSKRQISHVFNEKRVLQSVRFPFVIHLEFTSKDNDSLYLGLCMCYGGDLFTYHRKRRRLSEDQARFYASQIVLALEYLHYMGVVYRDLKPENIMLDHTGYIKLADFGFAKRIRGRTYTLCGTPEYLAPELIKLRPYGSSVDWWAFGVILYELVAGSTPFALHNYNIMSMYAKICDCDYVIPPHFSRELSDLIERFLIRDVTKRFGCVGGGVKDIKSHEWFSSIDWYDVLNMGTRPAYVPTVRGFEDVSNFRSINPSKHITYIKSMKNQYGDIFDEF